MKDEGKTRQEIGQLVDEEQHLSREQQRLLENLKREQKVKTGQMERLIKETEVKSEAGKVVAEEGERLRRAILWKRVYRGAAEPFRWI